MQVIIPTISDPGSFVYDPENPTAYTEACSHAIHQILHALSDAGFTISEGEGNLYQIDIARDRDFDEITVLPASSFDD